MRSISDISEGGLGSSGTDGHANPGGKFFSHRSSREGLRNPLAPSFPVRMKHVGKELTDIVRSISIGHEKIFIVDVWMEFFERLSVLTENKSLQSCEF